MGLELCGASFCSSSSSPVAPVKHIEVHFDFRGAISVLNEVLYLSGQGFSLRKRFASVVSVTPLGCTSESFEEYLEASDFLWQRLSFAIVSSAIEPVVVERFAG